MRNAPEPVFEAPWHAQLFALTVHLNETGHFVWPDWADRFGATLRQHGLAGELNGEMIISPHGWRRWKVFWLK